MEGRNEVWPYGGRKGDGESRGIVGKQNGEKGKGKAGKDVTNLPIDVTNLPIDNRCRNKRKRISLERKAEQEGQEQEEWKAAP